MSWLSGFLDKGKAELNRTLSRNKAFAKSEFISLLDDVTPRLQGLEGQGKEVVTKAIMQIVAGRVPVNPAIAGLLMLGVQALVSTIPWDSVAPSLYVIKNRGKIIEEVYKRIDGARF